MPVTVLADDEPPDSAGALLVIGTSMFDGQVPSVLSAALQRDLPVLGVGWGMHAVNSALAGALAVDVPNTTGEAQRMPVFISPGAKLSYTIAGSGWVTVPFDNTTGIRAKELAPRLMASCYREDGFMAGIELPGRNWVIGVQWNAHEIESLPAGFDSLLLALVERAAGTQ
jgi:gamma-glutamyl-gamma-aminobutyrate hydrolase PuuD